MARHDYEPTGVRDDGVIRTGVRGDKSRLQQYRILFSDGETRTFWALHGDTALEYAKTWGRSHGGLTVAS